MIINKIVWSIFFSTVTPIPYFSKTRLYPAVYGVTTDISEYDGIPGITLPVHAALGSSGRSCSRVCVEVSLEPSGIVMMIGFVASDIPIAYASVTRKWCLAPESNISQFSFPLGLELIVFNMFLAACE